MRIFFPNASIKYPPTTGGDIHRYQLIKNLVGLGHSVHTLLPDQNPATHKHAKRPWSVLRELRAADALYCRVVVDRNPATDLSLPHTRWLIPPRTVVSWEFNVSLTYSLSHERTKGDVDHAVAQLRRAAPRVDVAICVTRQLADEARDLLGIREVHVLQNASDPDMFRRDLPRPDGLDIRPGRLHVVFIGSGTETYHNIPLICAAAEFAVQRQLPLDFHVFGGADRLFPQNYPENLHLHGPVAYLDLPKYLAAMDVGLVLYKMQANGLSPLKLFDYLASGCVPVCSPSQPMREVLDGRDAGFIDEWSAQSLCDALEQLHRDRPRLERMRMAGRELILKEYSWRRVAENTVQIIDRVRTSGRT